jgi:membrane protease YdiL (CAAX protease family)
MSTARDATARRDCAAVVFALVYPTLLTVGYFILLAKPSEGGLQQIAFGVGKSLQFLFPVAWVFWIQSGRPVWQRPRSRDLAAGAIAGLLLLVAAVALYYLWLKPAGVFDEPAVKVREKIAHFGIDTKVRYLTMALFYCAVHSLMEEYYWRWFVFAQLRRLTSFPMATIVSSLGFTSHHVLVLAEYFGWTSPWTYLFSLGVAVGGAIWAWMYEKTGSLYGLWASHALVDAAIFIVGYDLL